MSNLTPRHHADTAGGGTDTSDSQREAGAAWDEQQQPRTASFAGAKVASRASDRDRHVDERVETEREPRRDESELPEDESIEEYMVALLDRTRRNATAGAAPIDRSSNKRESNIREQPQRVARDVPLEPTAGSVREIVPGPAKLKRRAPIEAANLAAMREVAIAEAELAINTHGRKQLIRTALATSSAALGCVLGAMLVLSTVAAHHTTLRTLANIGFAGAVLWLFTAGHIVAVTVRRATIEAERDAR